MDRYRIAIGPSSFSKVSSEAIDMLEAAGCELIINPYGRKLSEDETIDLIKDADGLIAGLEPLNRRVLSAAPKLKAIARVGIGVDNIDFDAAKEFDIKVSKTPNGPTDAVAEMTVAAMLGLCRELFQSNKDMHNQIWNKNIGIGLKDTKVLLIGYGRIGHRVSELLKPFGADIMIYDPFLAFSDDKIIGRKVSLEYGIKEAQVISLHASGKKLILGESEFQQMRDHVILLNSARGELIQKEVLIKALGNGKVAKVWMDAFWEEPYKGELCSYEQALLTPHISTYTSQCRNSMEIDAVKNLFKDMEITL